MILTGNVIASVRNATIKSLTIFAPKRRLAYFLSTSTDDLRFQMKTSNCLCCSEHISDRLAQIKDIQL